MNQSMLAAQIRAKKVGVLIKDARLASGKSVDECARVMGINPEQLYAYESGVQAPSLPELELLAYSLSLPLDHFWGSATLAAAQTPQPQFDPKRMVDLRRKMIGVMLRQARQESGLDLAFLAQKTGISPAALEQYESGEKPVPLPALEQLLTIYNKPLKDFQDRQGVLGQWYLQQNVMQTMKEMPPDLTAFIAKPINRPYLELAQRLSEMSVEKLRSVAEGLLEITL